MKYSLLCVDDEPDNVDSLERLFRKKFQVYKATSGEEALKQLAQIDNLAIIISDQRMPKMTGVEFLQKTIPSHPETVKMLLTGYTDIESVIDAINSGEIYRYITKPWDPQELMLACDQAIEKYELIQELRQKNQELDKAYSELKTLDQAKDRFMILVNHELKTPLTSILSYSQLLAETQMNEEQSLFLDRITAGADRLQAIVNDVLTIVSAEAGQIKVEKQNHKVGQFMPQLDQKLYDFAENKKQKIQFDWSDDQAIADKKIINEVLQRIIHNAIKFGDDHSDIRISSKKENDQQVKLTVTNSGKAIPSKTIKKILEPFTLEENIMNHSTGIGLGLSLSQALLKTHSSQLDFNSEANKVSVSFNLDSI